MVGICLCCFLLFLSISYSIQMCEFQFVVAVFCCFVLFVVFILMGMSFFDDGANVFICFDTVAIELTHFTSIDYCSHTIIT